MYFYQRKLIFMPPADILTVPPAYSIYKSLPVDVAGVGRIVDWYVPASDSGKPTIVFFHGNASDRTDFMQAGERFHKIGWGVLLTSYPGYSGNPGNPTESTLMQSARASLDALGHPAGGVLLWGHSLGSGVAARMASEGRGEALLLEAPYTSVVDVAAAIYPIFPARLIVKDQFDTLSLVPHIAVPVMIIHGDGDPVVPFAMGKELAEHFGNRAVFVPIPHFASHFPHADRDLNEMVDHWWLRH
ncbi:MAG TPA: alpha/beta hydrolase [Burkholderiaceae bacterium]